MKIPLRNHFRADGSPKVAYHGRREAVDAAVAQNGGKVGGPYMAYLCDFCHGWHIGRHHNRSRTRRAGRAA